MNQPDAQERRPFAIRTSVRWGDCDPAGIAFYPRFFEWLDQCSHILAREMGISRDDALPPRPLGFPLVGAQAEFLAPARLDDRIEVRAWVTRIGRSSYALRHEVVRLGDEEALLARCSESRVLVRQADDGTMRPLAISPQMRAVLERYLAPDAGG